MARPREIDGKIVVRLRSLTPKVPWESIAQALSASRAGVIAAYNREVGATAPVACPTCNAAMTCPNGH